MSGLLRLCRLYYAAPMSLILLLTIAYIRGASLATEWPGALRATAALALVIAGGYALNDVWDAGSDRTNAPWRPIPAGRVAPRRAAAWAAGLLAAGLALAATCRGTYFAVLALVAAAVVFYDLTSKRLGLGKQILVAALMTCFYPLAFAYAGRPAGARATALYFFPAWIFLTSFGYETLKDLRDVRGDRLVTAAASWVQRRPQRALFVARLTILCGAAALVGPALAGCGWVYAAIIPAALGLALWAVFLPERPARRAIYAQFVVVGIAAAADWLILGP